MMAISDRQRDLFGFFAAFFAGWAVYAFGNDSLQGSFCLDDRGTVAVNSCVKPEESSLGCLWERDYWGQDNVSSPNSHKSWRPVTTLSFRLNYGVHGMDPFGYHVVNTALHATVSGLVVLVARVFIKSSTAAAAPHDAAAPAPIDALLPATAGLLFALHPVHVEAVANISGRADVLCAFFYLLGFLNYARIRSKRDRRSDFNPVEAVELVISTGLFTLLALLSKEHGVTLPVVCVAWEMLCGEGRSLSGMLRLAWRGLPRARAFIVRSVALGVMTIGIAMWRLSKNGGTAADLNARQNPAAVEPLWSTRSLSYSWLWVCNCWQVLWPARLCPDWSDGTIPLLYADDVLSGSEWRRILPIALLYACVARCGWLILLSENWSLNRRLEAGACAFLILSYLLSSNFLVTVGFVLAERVLYLPSVAFALLQASNPPLPRTCRSLAVVHTRCTPSSPPPRNVVAAPHVAGN